MWCGNPSCGILNQCWQLGESPALGLPWHPNCPNKIIVTMALVLRMQVLAWQLGLFKWTWWALHPPDLLCQSYFQCLFKKGKWGESNKQEEENWVGRSRNSNGEAVKGVDLEVMVCTRFYAPYPQPSHSCSLLGLSPLKIWCTSKETHYGGESLGIGKGI